MGFEIDPLHFRFCNLHPGFVLGRVQLGPDFEAGLCACRSDQLDHGFVTDKGLPLPVEADEGKHPVLDLVPLARPRRKVAHRDGEPGAIRQPLKFPFPEPEAGAVAPAGIRGDQQRLSVTVCALYLSAS